MYQELGYHPEMAWPPKCIGVSFLGCLYTSVVTQKRDGLKDSAHHLWVAADFQKRRAYPSTVAADTAGQCTSGTARDESSPNDSVWQLWETSVVCTHCATAVRRPSSESGVASSSGRWRRTAADSELSSVAHVGRAGGGRRPDKEPRNRVDVRRSGGWDWVRARSPSDRRSSATPPPRFVHT